MNFKFIYQDQKTERRYAGNGGIEMNSKLRAVIPMLEPVYGKHNGRGDRIGVFYVMGKIEDQTPTSRMMDQVKGSKAVIVLLSRNATLPTDIQGSKERITMPQAWNDVRGFHQFPIALKMLVKGFERIFGKSVLYVGSSIPDTVTIKTDENGTFNPANFKLGPNLTFMMENLLPNTKYEIFTGMPGEPVPYKQVWMVVPPTEDERWHGKPITNDELVELINFLLILNDEIEMLQSSVLQEEAITNLINRSGRYRVSKDRVHSAFRTRKTLNYTRYDPAVIVRLVPDYDPGLVAHDLGG